MSPRDFDRYRGQARSAAQMSVMTGLDIDYLERAYGLVVLMDDLFADGREQ